MPGGEEAFSNPSAPPDHQTPAPEKESVKDKNENPLTNDDFRKLLMTPRVGSGGSRTESRTQSAGYESSGGLHKGSRDEGPGKRRDSSGPAADKKDPGKKKITPKPKKSEEDDLLRILKNYRDRANERRQGETKEAAAELEMMRMQGGYKAVGHDARSSYDAAERRKKMIEESKYLGGDLEHTHLVKGLDYALLQKVRSEITSKEQEEEELEELYHQRKNEREEVEGLLKTALAKNIYRVLFKDTAPKWNELFAPRRMAYLIELDEDSVESEIPTTVLRSKQDCPVDEAATNLTTNDMVIQKLTHVLSYLRTDTKRKKKEKGGEGKAEDIQKMASQSIYDDAVEYVPDTSKSHRREEKQKPYFAPDKDEVDRRERKRDGDHSRNRDERDKARSQRPREKEANALYGEGWAPADLRLQKGETKQEKGGKKERDPFRKTEPGTKGGVKMSGLDPDSYAECYPGYNEGLDNAGDSDDEADFTKMDMGNRKGPIKRWDFDNEEDYEKYMSKREAMPKAAFQYGLKMNDGRKTRKMGSGNPEKDQKQKIDREWQKISKILSKRSDPGDGGSQAKVKRKS